MFPKKFPIVVVAALSLSVATFTLAEAGPITLEGTWAPKSLGCNSSLKLVVNTEAVSLVNGSDRYSEPRIKFVECLACEGGARYTGIAIWLIPDTNPESWAPFSIQYNAKEERGRTIVHIEEIQFDIKHRFPLDRVELRACKPET